MKKWEVYPIQSGTFQVNEGVLLKHGSITTIRKVASLVFYLKNEKNKVIVDASFISVEKAEQMFGLPCTKDEDMVDSLARYGVDPDEIDTVIFTHLHWDHIENADLFTKAQFYCQRDEISWAISSPHWEGAYQRDSSSHLVKVSSRLKALPGSCVLTDGLSLIKLGGHTPGSQAVMVETDAGKVAICGDNVFLYENIHDNIPVGLYHSLRECESCLYLLRSQSDIILPSHDLQVIDRYAREVKDSRVKKEGRNTLS